MIAKNKTNQKFISALLIILILAPAVLFSVPGGSIHAQEEGAIPEIPCVATSPGASVGCATQTGQIRGQVTATSTKTASWISKVFQGFIVGSSATTAANTTKEWAAQLVRYALQTFARRLLAQMTQATVNWINTGFHGQPLFLERPGAFFKDIAKSEIKDMVNMLGYNSSQYPFGKSFAISVIEGFKTTSAQNAQYSLSRVINDPVLLKNYRTNFATGGWPGFVVNTQYPQNNYIGFQMEAGNELSRKLAGTTQSKANQVKELLAQGQGFLSPQVCPDNNGKNNYNNNNNPFQQPTFKCSAKAETPATCNKNIQTDTAYQECVARNTRLASYYSAECKRQEAAWAEKNVCKGGLVNTTPGSVVGASIMKAITGPYDQTSLAAAMGNSLSAIFDALLNKFLSSGLNSLSNKLSGTGSSNNNDDNFNYDGHTLGSPNVTTTNGPGFDWNGTPDEIIVLSTFKLNVQNAINKANEELKLIDNDDPNAPGLLQIYAQIWPKTHELNICLAGPNESALDKESRELQEKLEREQKTDELNARKNTILETIAKLESINTDLGTLATDPVRGSAQETMEISRKREFDAMIINISTASTISETQTKLDEAKAKLAGLDPAIAKCIKDRDDNPSP